MSIDCICSAGTRSADFDIPGLEDLPVYDGLVDPFCPIHGEPLNLIPEVRASDGLPHHVEVDVYGVRRLLRRHRLRVRRVRHGRGGRPARVTNSDTGCMRRPDGRGVCVHPKCVARRWRVIKAALKGEPA